MITTLTLLDAGMMASLSIFNIFSDFVMFLKTLGNFNIYIQGVEHDEKKEI